uniref:Natural killer cells antigen CD94 n=1 Tax=Catagonus wagneri TaxID=51154 RepID=A0A8C3WBI0_9CETA
MAAFNKQTVHPGPSTDLLEGSDCCSCQEKWIGYQCNCYFISNELKTWEDSRNFCISHNSSLLQMQSRNELHFMSSSTYFYWTGLSFSDEHHAWLWEDNSTLSQDLHLFFNTVNPKNCIIYNPRGSGLDEDCGSEHLFICKQRLS